MHQTLIARFKHDERMVRTVLKDSLLINGVLLSSVLLLVVVAAVIALPR